MQVRLQQFAGYGGIVGGIALAAAYLTHPATASPVIVASTAWIWIHVGFMVSLIAGVFLLFALFALYLQKTPAVTGAIGFVLAVMSLVFVFGLDYSEVFIFPVLAVEFSEVVVRYGDGTSMPSVAFAFPVTGVAFLIGFVLFSYELMRTATVSHRAALVTIVGTVVFAAGLSGFLPMFVVRSGSVVFGLGLALMGLELSRTGAR